jgi:hypothetical protein
VEEAEMGISYDQLAIVGWRLSYEEAQRLWQHAYRPLIYSELLEISTHWGVRGFPGSYDEDQLYWSYYVILMMREGYTGFSPTELLDRLEAIKPDTALLTELHDALFCLYDESLSALERDEEDEDECEDEDESDSSRKRNEKKSPLEKVRHRFNAQKVVIYAQLYVH